MRIFHADSSDVFDITVFFIYDKFLEVAINSSHVVCCNYENECLRAFELIFDKSLNKNAR